MFEILHQSKKSSARRGILKTAHGAIPTPFFLPIATKGSVKALASSDLKNLGAEIILSNTYHLYLQPGLKVLKKFGGLHKFMNWQGPILTDSGGYQVFSLGAGKREKKDVSFVKIIKDGVKFKSFLDGSEHFFTPESVQEIQDIIGADIKMVLDVCSPHPCSKKQAAKDLELTHEWAKRALEYQRDKRYEIRDKNNKNRSAKLAGEIQNSLLFGIVQGSTYKDLRLKSAKFLSKLNFDGLAIGGLAVGEENKKMYEVLKYTVPELPKNKPRYLMGVGKPENIIEAVKQGIDMFDCVIPTREARHGRLYLWCHPERSPLRSRSEASEGPHRNITKKNFYKIININNAKFKNNTKPIDKNCSCEFCQNYSAGYLQHLFKAGEPLALRLATLHNLKFFLDLFFQIRYDIKKGTL
ncbi:MAG: tRNA guanosine(34) transglycosylase Tgt [Patescibacteria group bacterium]|nr:tRNA guanosine(34) transglycosylase Tgt [Patescibacteria group bacterium]